MRIGSRIAMMKDGRIVQIGTSEQILNDPANDYVAQFVQDVDRTRVLTAGVVAERPERVLRADQGPMAAHKLLREGHLPWIVVVERDGTPTGILWEDDVAQAVADGRTDLPWSAEHQTPVVAEDTPLAELFGLAARHRSPIVVTGPDGRLAGVVPRVTLLTSVGADLENPDETFITHSDATTAAATGGIA